MTQRAEPAQHGHDQSAGERTIALLKCTEFTRAIEAFVERAMSAQHAIDDICGDAADSEPRHVIRTAGKRSRLACARHAQNSSLQPRHGYAKSSAMPTDRKPPG